jgi:hypothetical protein
MKEATMSPLELMLYLLAIAGGLIPLGLVALMLLSMNRADARRQDRERRKAGTLRGAQ